MSVTFFIFKKNQRVSRVCAHKVKLLSEYSTDRILGLYCYKIKKIHLSFWFNKNAKKTHIKWSTEIKHCLHCAYECFNRWWHDMAHADAKWHKGVLDVMNQLLENLLIKLVSLKNKSLKKLLSEIMFKINYLSTP